MKSGLHRIDILNVFTYMYAVYVCIYVYIQIMNKLALHENQDRNLMWKQNLVLTYTGTYHRVYLHFPMSPGIWEGKLCNK